MHNSGLYVYLVWLLVDSLTHTGYFPSACRLTCSVQRWLNSLSGGYLLVLFISTSLSDICCIAKCFLASVNFCSSWFFFTVIVLDRHRVAGFEYYKFETFYPWSGKATLLTETTEHMTTTWDDSLFLVDLSYVLLLCVWLANWCINLAVMPSAIIWWASAAYWLICLAEKKGIFYLSVSVSVSPWQKKRTLMVSAVWSCHYFVPFMFCVTL